MLINPGSLRKKIELITNTVVDGKVTPKSVSVWAENTSISRNEFYASYQSGLNPQIMFKIRPSAYELSKQTNQEGGSKYADSIIYAGRTYKIIRTYETKDIIELICG